MYCVSMCVNIWPKILKGLTELYIHKNEEGVYIYKYNWKSVLVYRTCNNRDKEKEREKVFNKEN